MRAFTLFLLSLALGVQASAQDVGRAEPTDVAALPHVLNFEDQRNGGPPSGWNGGPASTLFSDNRDAHRGGWAARLERNANSPGTFSSLHRAIAMNVAGKTVELRGFLRTQDVDGFAGLWMREDDRDGKRHAFENMGQRKLSGTTDWTRHSITLPLEPETDKLFFGVLLTGSGRLWVDDLELLVDGKPVWKAPKRPPTPLDTDRQFDAGSGLSLSRLDRTQIENLATLGRVWGFLKYHHPAVTAGKAHWDYALLRVVPKVLRAADRAGANAIILEWIDELGPVARCSNCARLKEQDLHLRPDLAWIDDTAMLGEALSASLRAIERNREAGSPQFYVSLAPGVRNALFKRELAYSGIKFPDPGFQLLALYRFWNAVEYWSPYRDVIGEDWRQVLTEFIPRIALAEDGDAYQLEFWALLAKLNDGHAVLHNTTKVLPPTGECHFPFKVRFLGDRAVVDNVLVEESRVERGDVITAIDGVPIAKLLERWRSYYPASNEWARLSLIARLMTRGPCGDGTLDFLRDEQALTLGVARAQGERSFSGRTHDLPGPTFRLLSKDVAYVKLSSIKAADLPGYIEAAAGAKGLIVDIRNYPNDFVPYALGALLVTAPTPFARFTKGDLDSPGAFYWHEPLTLQPAQPHFAGKVVVLIDELSQSQSEFTAMAFRAAPKAIVIGTPTTGADGNVSRFNVPGGFTTQITGIGVFYPDKRVTQRVGIIPDINISPTIRGIRENRDEVLEEAIRQIVGTGAAEDDVRRIASPSEH